MQNEQTESQSDVELLPCPFCGGEARSYYNSSCDCCGFISGVVHCRSCPAEVNHFNTEAEAIAAWNTRTLPRDPQGLVEALRQIGEPRGKFSRTSGLHQNAEHTLRALKAFARAALAAWEAGK